MAGDCVMVVIETKNANSRYGGYIEEYETPKLFSACMAIKVGVLFEALHIILENTGLVHHTISFGHSMLV